VALGLRRTDGLRRQAFAAEFGADPAARYGAEIATGVKSGLLELGEEHLRLSAKGRLLASEALLPFVPEPATAGAA
jgi:oxygen-independent coproporphyrinogen-3 oxidase